MRNQHHIIKEASDSLSELFQRQFKEHGYKRVNIVTDAPKPEAVEGKLPAVCLYLYQIGPDWESSGAPTTQIIRRRDEKGKIEEVERQGPTWVRLDYLVSPFAQNREDEQLLLGLILKTLHEVSWMARSELKGDSFEDEDWLNVTMASRLDEGTLARFWSSMGQPARPAVAMWTVVPIRSYIEQPIKRVQERVFGYQRLGLRPGEGSKEIGPAGNPDIPPPGEWIKRTQ